MPLKKNRRGLEESEKLSDIDTGWPGQTKKGSKEGGWDGRMKNLRLLHRPKRIWQAIVNYFRQNVPSAQY